MISNSHSKKSNRFFFTLIELLVVVAVLSILMSLFVPSLKRVMRNTKELICVSNLKSVGMGIKMYTDDNYDFYPDRSIPVPSSRSDGKGIFKGRLYATSDLLRMLTYKNNDVETVEFNIYKGLVPYHGDRESMQRDYLCPFIKEELIASADNAWQKSYPQFPYKQSNWHGTIGSYNLYFSTLYKETNKNRQFIVEPMLKLGDTWKMGRASLNDTGGKYSNVVASDHIRANVGKTPNANHPTLYGKNTLVEDSGTGPGWLYDNHLPTSSAYLIDDMSVFLETEVCKDYPQIGGKYPLVPTRFFSEGI
jgi:prepilin-type N-terminal cleavage/methylation domain-containing protein